MLGKREIGALTILIGVACWNPARAQAPPPSVLIIDVGNVVEYQGDVSDPTKFDTNSAITPSAGVRPFAPNTAFGDIVAVNGQPAKGVWVANPLAIGLTTTFTAGRSIADTSHASLKSHTFEILKSDGSPIGTVMCFGLDGSTPPPGAPVYPVDTRGNFAVFGGTGAFLGARGELVQRAQALEAVPPRAASVVEDPAYRRINGGGNIRFYLHLLPLTTPQIATTLGGPAVTHSFDSSLVTSSRPAAAGETLWLFASGLGPTVPGVNPGEPFLPGVVSVVNSPVAVTVNGKSAEVLSAVGYPGEIDGYLVSFAVPPDAAKGPATIQISAAWITSGPVSITIQ